MLPDEEIMKLLWHRSETAVSELEKKYGSLFFCVAKRYLGSDRDAEECVNDTYLAVWNSIPPQCPKSMKAYGCKIVRNQAVKRYISNTAQKRSEWLAVPLEELEDCLASDNDVENMLRAKDLGKAIEQFLSRQSQENRVIFLRRYWFLDSYEDIADRTGLSVKNISVRLTRLRKKLKQYLIEEGVL